MWKRLTALVTASSATYLTTFSATSLAFVGLFTGHWPTNLSELMSIIAIMGGTGALATSAISIFRRKQIANSTVGRWLGAVAVSGALHSVLVLGLLSAGVTAASWPTALAILAAPAAASSALFIRSGKFGFLGSKQPEALPRG